MLALVINFLEVGWSPREEWLETYLGVMDPALGVLCQAADRKIQVGRGCFFWGVSV